VFLNCPCIRPPCISLDNREYTQVLFESPKGPSYEKFLRPKNPKILPWVAVRGRRTVRNEKDVLDVAHDKPSHNTRHIPYSIGWFCQRAAWRTGRQNKLYPFHVKPVQRLQLGTNISAYSFLCNFVARLCTPLGFCAVMRREWESLCHGSSGLRRSNPFRWLLQTSYLDNCLSPGAQLDVTEACVQVEGGHIERLLPCAEHSDGWQVPITRTRSTTKWVLWSDSWKMLQGAE